MSTGQIPIPATAPLPPRRSPAGGPGEEAFVYAPPPATLPVRMVCRISAQITAEMVMLAGSRVQMHRDRRRALCHVRQIAMYVCHVVLQIPLTDIGRAFGRDRTTVGHACNIVEDRRDDPAFDEFVSAVERTVSSVFRGNGERP